eukprot:812933-Prymnesium_polylepis.1
MTDAFCVVRGAGDAYISGRSSMAVRPEWHELAEDQATETPKVFVGQCFHSRSAVTLSLIHI